MEDQKIKRINELYKKQKAIGLSEKEQKEQMQLRKEYVELFKKNFKQTMDHVRIQEEDGTLRPIKPKQ